MATNPSINILAADGKLQAAINTADEVVLKLGVASGGRFLIPQRVSSVVGVCSVHNFGPLVRSGAHHVDYSGACYVMRMRASNAGTVSSVTKAASSTYPASSGGLALSLQSYTLHASAPAGAALNLNSGWSLPSVALPLTITVTGGGTVAHTQTVTYLDEDGEHTTEVLTWSAAAAKTTTGLVSQVLSVVSNVDPGGVSTYTATHSTVGDRLYGVVTVTQGGQIGVSGATLPKYKVSYDGDAGVPITNSRSYTLDTTGIAELSTYAGGLTAQPTGLKATFSAGTNSASLYGGALINGATDNGDMMADMRASGVTITVAVAGMGTAFSIGVVGSAITINSATDGGGAATTTAATAAAAVNAHATAGLLVKMTAMGTGLGILAAQASTGATNGPISWQALVEGVRVKQTRGAAGTAAIAISCTVVGTERRVVITPVTDAAGEQTSTATTIAAAIAAHSTASTWLVGTAGGTGGGIIGCLDEYVNLPISLATGDKFTFTTTPPTASSSDLQEALNALLANETWLSYFSVLHVVGESDDTKDAILATFAETAANSKKAFKTIVVEGTFQGSTAESTWTNALISTFATKSRLYGVVAGEVNALNGAYGTVDRMPFATPYVARLMICPLGEQPSHVECDTILGTQYQLSGVLDRPSTSASLWQSEDALATLNSNNFVTARKHPGRSGIYVRQGLNFTVDGSDYAFVSYGRISNVARTIAYDQGLRFLNASMAVDPKTGHLAEHECQKMESQLSGALRRKLCGNDNGRTHTSSVQVVLQRNDNFVQSKTINGNIYIVPKGVAETINLTAQFSPQSV